MQYKTNMESKGSMQSFLSMVHCVLLTAANCTIYNNNRVLRESYLQLQHFEACKCLHPSWSLAQS